MSVNKNKVREDKHDPELEYGPYARFENALEGTPKFRIMRKADETLKYISALKTGNFPEFKMDDTGKLTLGEDFCDVKLDGSGEVKFEDVCERKKKAVATSTGAAANDAAQASAATVKKQLDSIKDDDSLPKSIVQHHRYGPLLAGDLTFHPPEEAPTPDEEVLAETHNLYVSWAICTAAEGIMKQMRDNEAADLPPPGEVKYIFEMVNMAYEFYTAYVSYLGYEYVPRAPSPRLDD